MKKYFILVCFITLLAGCADKKPTHAELVTHYYEAFNASDFNQLTTLIGDSITITEGDYVMPFSQDSFHEQFKWDSIFQPTYKIVQLEDLSNEIVATVASSSKRYEFLKNNPLTCTHKFSFDSNKITKLETLECKDANWDVWEKERELLVNWVKVNHPELDGFINDLTMDGAINYLKAIELYENSVGAK